LAAIVAVFSRARGVASGASSAVTPTSGTPTSAP